MSQARNFAEQYAYAAWNRDVPLRVSSAEVGCGVCKLGRQQRKLCLARCTFRHRYRKNHTIEAYACLTCLGRTLNAPNADLVMIRAIHNQELNREFCPAVFAAIDSLRGTGILAHHEVLADAVSSHAAGEHWSPAFVGKVSKVALVFAADPDLTRAFVWLRRHPHEIARHPELHGMSAKFSGLYDAWPSARDRTVVQKIMDETKQ